MNETSNTQINLETMKNFLTTYRQLRDSVSDSRVNPDYFIKKFIDFREQFSELKAKLEIRQLREAPDYNIFQILRLTRNEVRTHSAFLAHLLTPNASHGQGVLFLESFLQLCKQKYHDFPDIPSFNNPMYWLVSTEESTIFGRIDIVIQNPLEGFLCVIENKVDAFEGADQLLRYGKWMELDENKQSYPHRALCYLTKKGSISLTAGEYKYFSLSYKPDITQWLEDALDQILAPDVKVIVHQYQAIVANL